MTAPHPAAYTALSIPFGMVSGFASVTLVYLATERGASVQDAAGLASLAVLPQIACVLWAPVVDLTLSRKRWYAIACTTAALAVAAAGAAPVRKGSLGWLSIFVLIAATAASLLAMSVESLMAHHTATGERGRVGGWFQAGTLGGMGLGGGAGLWLATHLESPRLAAGVVALAMSTCQLALFFVSEPARLERGDVRAGLRGVAREIADLAKRREGRLTALICVLPIGTGAAANLWAAVAGDWGASADTVALVTGGASGVTAALGALAGGPLSDRLDRRLSYLVFCSFMAAITGAMALAPRTPLAFVLGTLAYAFANGLIYTGFAALVLETIGEGAAATKYNLYAALVYAPVFYMTQVGGRAYAQWGSSGLLWTETALGILGAALVGARLPGRSRVVPL